MFYLCHVLVVLFFALLVIRLCVLPATSRVLEVPEFNAVVGRKVALPCNLTPPLENDSISLVLWYRGDSGNPIYSVDARTEGPPPPKHFASKILGSRAEFNVSAQIALLEISPVKEDDAAEYRCRVDFRRARTQNQIMKLNIIVPPESIVIKDAENKTVSGMIGPFKEGSSLSLSCESKGGRPPPSVTWWRGSTLLDDSSTSVTKGIVRNELLLLNLHRQDLMTSLVCQASNTNLTVPISSSLTIDLNLKPYEVHITTPFRPLSAGELIEVTCQTYGSRPPARITWWKDSEKIVHASRETIASDGNSTTSYLLFVGAKEDSAKDLLCRAENPELPGSALEDKWRLNVYFVPQLSLALGASEKHEEIREGSDVYFECNIHANPPVLEIGWLFESQIMISDPSTGLVIRNQSLHLRNVGRSHRGRYQCSAINLEGEGKSEEVFLRVQFSPVCKAGQKMVYGVAKHEEVNISCEVEADPSEVSFRWKFNNSAESLDVLSYNIGVTRSMARYMPRTNNDYGALYCWGKNSVGVQQQPCIFNVIPTGPPDPVENCSVINQTSASLVLGCHPGEDGGVKQLFHLEVYSMFAEELITNVTSWDEPVFAANGLSAGSSFLLVIYASNAKGRSSSVAFIASTLFSAERHTDDIQPVAISAVLAVLMGIVGVLVLLAIVIIFVMKSREEKNKAEVKKKEEEHDEKYSSPIGKPFDNAHGDVLPNTNFSTGYTDLTRNALTERIYENFADSSDHTYENIITRVAYRIKENYDDITYAELTLPSNQQSLIRKPLDPPTEYADIDFLRGTKPLSPEIEKDEPAGNINSKTLPACLTSRAFEDG